MRNPFQAIPAPTWPTCGKTVRLRFCGEQYEANCTLKPEHPAWMPCKDGIGSPLPESNEAAEAAYWATVHDRAKAALVREERA